MNLEEFRQNNPAYTDKAEWPDEKLASSLYNKFYKDQMSRDSFNTQISFKPEAEATMTGEDPWGYSGPVKEQMREKEVLTAKDRLGNEKEVPESENLFKKLYDMSGPRGLVNMAFDEIEKSREPQAEGPTRYAMPPRPGEVRDTRFIDDPNDPGNSGEEERLGEPWVNPGDAATGPMGPLVRNLAYKAGGKVVSKIAGKTITPMISEKMAAWGMKKTAKAVAASLAAEPAVGMTMEKVDDALTDGGTPDIWKLPVNLATGIITGTLVEGGLTAVASKVKRALASSGLEATPENTFKIMQKFKVDEVDEAGTETIVRKEVQTKAPPLDMKTAVKAITKHKAKTGQGLPTMEEVADGATNGIKVGKRPKHSAVKEAAQAQGSESTAGMIIGGAAGVSQDEDGNITIDGKEMIGGMGLGMILGTRMPGLKGKAKAAVKFRRGVAKRMKGQGIDADAIFAKTRMYQGPDGRWRHEISDDKVFFDPPCEPDDYYTLGTVLEHPELYEFYPQLKDMEVIFDPADAGSGLLGSFSPMTPGANFNPKTDPPGHITLTSDADDDKNLGTLLHEVQHAVQHIEGHANGSSPDIINSLAQSIGNQIAKAKTIINGNASALGSTETLSTTRKKMKTLTRLGNRLGVLREHDEVIQASTRYVEAEKKALLAKDALGLARATGDKVAIKTNEALVKETQEAFKNARVTRDEARLAYENAAHESYERVYGEQESRGTDDRKGLPSLLRDKSKPHYDGDPIVIEEVERILKDNIVRSHVTVGCAAAGGVYDGVDWEHYQDTGEIVIDEDEMIRGMFRGAALGMGMSAAPKAASIWTEQTRKRIVNPVKDITNGLITNETIRYQLGMNRSPEVAAILRDYKTKAKLILNKSVALGRELNKAAPNALAQKRLTQILEGGITTNVHLAKKAHQIHAMFKDLKDATRELGISHYSRWEALTRKQRSELTDIIRDEATPIAEKLTAQEMLKAHYKIGSAKEYLPMFDPRVEGLTKAEKSILKDEISNLKKRSRYMNPEGEPVLEDTIAQLEIMLKSGMRTKSKVDGLNLNKGYAKMRESVPVGGQALPAEAKEVFNKLVAASYRVAKGTATQATDVLKEKALIEIRDNPEWTWPRKARGDDEYIKAPANYIKLEGATWGALQGRYVRNDVVGDLQEVIDWRSNAERNMDKIMGMWKYGKAILNPATHARNGVSNMVLAYFAGVNPGDVKTYKAAADAIKDGRTNKYFVEAEDWGLFNNTFVDSDISAIRDELVELRSRSQLANWVRKAVAVPSTMYDQSERFFKLAVFIKQRQLGHGIDASAKHAEKYLFNYQDIPPGLKHYKRWVSPFITYTYKSTPIIAETAITKPWKIGFVAGSMYGLNKMAQSSLGVSEDEVTEDKRRMPDMSKTGTILLPFRDENGNKLYTDVEAFLPWGGMGQRWGQSNAPFSDVLPSNPIFTIGAAWYSNHEAFTGRELYDDVLDADTQILAKQLNFAWKQIAPSLAPGGYSHDALTDGFKNEFLNHEITDHAGNKKGLGEAVLKTMLGIRLRHADQEQLDRFILAKKRRIQMRVNKRKAQIMLARKRGEITQEKAVKQLKSLQLLQVDRVKEVLPKD